MFEAVRLASGVPCRVLLMLLCVLGAVLPAAAQTTTGAISGTVVDADGGVLPGVTATARNVDTGFTRVAVTEGDGRYRLAGLPIGPYELRAELPGFQTAAVPDLTITIGLELQQNLKLALGSIQETITVTGQAPAIETTQAAVTALVSKEQIAMLPLEGRSANAFVLLLPGTNMDASTTRRVNVNVGAGGLTNFATNYLVDGVHNMMSKSGEVRVDLPQSAIQEMKVLTTQAPAEYGGRLGGVVSMLSKSGTNLYHGEVFYHFRDKSLNRSGLYEQRRIDDFGEKKPDFRRNQGGFGLGGPIVQDRLHFFGAFEFINERKPFLVNSGKPEFYSALEGTFENGTDGTSYSFRSDLQINSQQNAFFRYGYQKQIVICENCGGPRSALSGGNIDVPRYMYVGGHTAVLSSRMLNEARVQYGFLQFRTYTPGFAPWTQNGVIGPERVKTLGQTQVYIFPSMTWGNDPSNNTAVNTTYYQVRDDFSITADDHGFKFGGGYLYLPLNEDRAPSAGSWTFSTDQFFDGSATAIANLRNPIQYTQTGLPSGFVRDQKTSIYEVYFQDDWRVLPNLTLNLGVRYDLQTGTWGEDKNAPWRQPGYYPVPLPFVDFSKRGDKNNVAPRLAFAWDVFGNQRSAVTGGYSLVYSTIQNGDHATEQEQTLTTNTLVRNPTYPDPYGGRSPLQFASTAPPNINIVADDLRNPPTKTYSLGFAQELGRDLALHIDGVYSKTTDFTRTANLNTPIPATGLRSLPTWGRILQLQPTGEGDYKGLWLRLEKRFSRRHLYTVAYTLSKQDTNWSSGVRLGSVTDFFNPSADEGPHTADRRHAIVASTAVLLPYNLTLGAVWNARTTMPFDALAGRDLNLDGANTDYVPGTTKAMGNRDNGKMLTAVNAWRAQNGLKAIEASQIDSNRYSRVDVRLSREFQVGADRRIDLIAQVFNVLGTDNLQDIGDSWVSNALSDSFGRLLTARARQQAELALRFRF